MFSKSINILICLAMASIVHMVAIEAMETSTWVRMVTNDDSPGSSSAYPDRRSVFYHWCYQKGMQPSWRCIDEFCKDAQNDGIERFVDRAYNEYVHVVGRLFKNDVERADYALCVAAHLGKPNEKYSYYKRSWNPFCWTDMTYDYHYYIMLYYINNLGKDWDFGMREFSFLATKYDNYLRYWMYRFTDNEASTERFGFFAGLIGSAAQDSQVIRPQHIRAACDSSWDERLAPADKVLSLYPGFRNIAGTVPEGVMDFVRELKHPHSGRMGLPRPRGLLLVGAPGTGKTTIAKAIAQELNAVILERCGSDFVRTYVGTGAAGVRDLYAKAIADKIAGNYDYAIVFIDELDAICRRRHVHSDGGLEYDNTTNQLLTYLDGCNYNGSIITIGATNRLDLLDEAVTRPSRLGNIVTLPLPDRDNRKKILKFYAGGFCDALDFDSVAGQTEGFSPDELKALVEGAKRCALRADRGASQVLQRHFDQALRNEQERRQLIHH